MAKTTTTPAPQINAEQIEKLYEFRAPTQHKLVLYKTNNEVQPYVAIFKKSGQTIAAGNNRLSVAKEAAQRISKAYAAHKAKLKEAATRQPTLFSDTNAVNIPQNI